MRHQTLSQEQLRSRTHSCTASRTVPGSDEVLLTVKGLAKHFGGLKAVDGVDMEVRRGEIQALIGPNGSGKTTILNMLSGLYIPTGGEIRLEGNGHSGKKPHVITAHGIARTFQNIRLFGELTVLDNVLIGQHCRSKAGLRPAFFDPSSQKSRRGRHAGEGIGDAGIRRPAGERSLPSPRACPMGSSGCWNWRGPWSRIPNFSCWTSRQPGLNAAETEALVELLFQICDRGITILLVEHDMSLVMNVSDHITVLNFGKKIAEGPAEEIEKNQEVIDAYLGTEVGNA